MHTRPIAILAAMTLVALGGCSADHQAEVPAAAGSTGADAESRAFIDPVTGEMRAPTAAEVAASRPPESTKPTVKQQPAPPVETRLPDGTIMYDMRDQPQVEEKVCVQADGSIGACPAK